MSIHSLPKLTPTFNRLAMVIFQGGPANCRRVLAGVSLPFFLLTLTASAQTNIGATTNQEPNTLRTSSGTQTNLSGYQLFEQIRSDCIRNRREVCGRIIKVLPAGLVVESGYTNLLREPLTRNWLVPGSVSASLAPDLVESREPGSLCVGIVYLTDYPKSKRSQPKLYDYVIIQAFPAGRYTYSSVGGLEKNVRHYSASLAEAVKLNYLAIKN